MNFNFLVDEDLSPQVAQALCEEGFYALHIRDFGALGSDDASVLDRAFDKDMIVITSNVLDFYNLAAARDVHGGIVFLHDGELRRHEQISRVVDAAKVIKKRDKDMVNCVLHLYKGNNYKFIEHPSQALA